jgi:hypothetical protein
VSDADRDPNAEVVSPEIVEMGAVAGAADGQGPMEAVEQPARVMRIGAMVRALLDEVRTASLDEGGRERLKEIYETSVVELKQSLSPDLQDELSRLAPPIEGTPSESELRIAQAQLVGWLEGLFHGIQATLFAQQMAARQQLEQMRGQLMPGQVPGPAQAPGPGAGGPAERPGTYL